MNKTFYALCLCLSGLTVSAQNPGGVSTGLTLWLKPDVGTSTTGSAVDAWSYANNAARTFTSTGAQRPTLSSNVINFWPGVNFDGTQFMTGPNGINAPIQAGDPDYSIFGVWSSTTATPGSFQRVWSQRGAAVSNDGASLWVHNDQAKYGDQAEISPYDHLSIRPFATNTWYISQLNLLPIGPNDMEAFDNFNLASGTNSVASTNNALRSISDFQQLLGARSTSADEPLIGSIGEVIVYDRPISGTERSQIFSYLAMKYGITTGTNLIASNGTTTFWNTTTNTGYNNDVFGLVRDNGSGLLITKSNPIATGGGSGAGKSGQGNITIWTPTLNIGTDLTAVMVGHNGASLSETTVGVPPGATTSQRIGRQWKVQTTGGGVSNVAVSINLSGLTVTGAAAKDYRLMVDEDGDGDFTTGTIHYYYPYSYIPNVRASWQFVNLSNGQYFSIITTASAALPVTWVSFTGQFKNDNVYLNWAVENNGNGNRYEVEHSIDGVHYNVIGTVENNTAIKNYNYTATTYSNGVNFYRIHQIDNDGKDIYSTIVSVNIKGSADFAFKVLDNPVKNNNLKLEVRSATSVKASIELWSLNGVRVLNRQQMINGGKANIAIPISNIPAGSYVLKVKTNGTVRTAGIVKL